MKKKSESILGMAFFGPALVLLTIFLFIPMILTLVFSFTDFFALNPGLTHFVGLENYFQVFKDDDFRQAFGNTVKFVVIIVPLQGLGALGLALLINKVTHCKTYFKVAIINLVIFGIANILFNIKYEQVDDMIIYSLYSGLDSTYNIHGIYIYPLICLVLSNLYKICSIINWHTVLLLSMQFICFTVIGTILLKNKSSKVGYYICKYLLYIIIVINSIYISISIANSYSIFYNI